jgi:Fanconi-associated nuclease 1
MPLNIQSTSKDGRTLASFFKIHDTGSHDGAKAPPAKRRRLDDDSPAPNGPKERVISDSDVEGEGEDEESHIPHQTDLESALPAVSTDAEAIEEYEAFKASQSQESKGTEERLRDRKWERGKSSIYVDAFNLALDTVLDEESHLFDEAEMEVFRLWRELNYEAQYLYVGVPNT